MATIIEDGRRVRVQVSNAELNTLLIQPAKNQGFIDFDPTRVAVKQNESGFEIVFERIETQ